MNNKTKSMITVFILTLALLAGCQTPASAPLPTPPGTAEQSEQTARPKQATQPV